MERPLDQVDTFAPINKKSKQNLIQHKMSNSIHIFLAVDARGYYNYPNGYAYKRIVKTVDLATAKYRTFVTKSSLKLR
jgi:hypothetical protein